jgi:PAS domain-containing protein
MAQPLTLILARNLAENMQLASFLVDAQGTLIFFNEAAGVLLGSPFEVVGPLEQEEWAQRFGPFQHDGEPAALDHLPLALTLRDGRPSQGRFHIHIVTGDALEVDVSALPMLAADGLHGALILLWPVEQSASDQA